ncbi:hypothetical protein H2509_13495 [Stappia sp. F7233]|uniref:Uncharacterized protein n=1 Tax=Stappia albiluteola TaxID=2758565 RepID=A0A839AGM6_9HYPH|nr:hypothetical protein [Stappia albiluteola]MBA5777467.1 hypothetical protein [Stappia albiluteola]MBA5777505.1 hypothetical protein [Stappia albiluteola]MBA5778084.1 hypothetical protein [Stappia albiluteola]MBA5778139.1 hypothetical protein [Stappia albiluteola]
MSANVPTKREYHGVVAEINNEWRLVNLGVRWAVQRNNGDVSRPWRTVAGSHRRDGLAHLVERLTGATAESVSGLHALPDLHPGHVGRPAGKRSDEYGGVVCLLGAEWRLIEEPGVPQWTLQRCYKSGWRDVSYSRRKDQIERRLLQACGSIDEAAIKALRALPDIHPGNRRKSN